MKLAGKAALITGGGTGIGRAIAEQFVVEGASVLITGRRREKLDEAVREIKENVKSRRKGGGGCIDAFPGDVAQPEDAEKMVAACVAEFGKLDIVIANAGVFTTGSIPDSPLEDYDQMMDINVKGTFLVCKYAIPEIVKAGGGSVITVASSLGVRPVAGTGLYGAAKAAVVHLTQAMALDHGAKNVRVNCIAPAFVRTPIHEGQSLFDTMEAYYEAMAPYHALNRIGEPEEIAHAAVYLCSDEASWITGEILNIDGGARLK